MKAFLFSVNRIVDQLHIRPSRTQWIRFAVSLALAILFWGWVTELQDPYTEKTLIGVPIEIGDLPDSLQVVSTLANATVTIAGAESRVRPVSQSDVTVSVDLSGVDGPGEYDVPLIVDAPNVNDQSVEPDQVTIQVDERMTEIFPLNVTITNPTDQTRSASNVVPEVTQVTVTGPASAVERVDEVILPVTVDQQADSFEETYMPFAVDAERQRVSEVQVLPETIPTRVEVQTRGRAVSVIPTVIGVPAEGFSVQQRRAIPDTIIVDGPPDVIDDLLFINTEPVDVTDATQSISTRVGLADLPEGVTVIEPSDGLVEVRVAIEDISTSSQTLSDLPVQPVGLADGLTATFEQGTASIQVSAPIDILQSMTPEDISVLVDLSGLGPGTHQVTPDVTVPQGATWQTTEPLTIGVTIEEAAFSSPEASMPVASPQASGGAQRPPVEKFRRA